jgi:hypothetical protein
VIGPHPDDPFAFRFSHDLVRESMIESLAPYQAIRLHLAVADALEAVPAVRGDQSERLAHHLWSAGPLADPGRTARALQAAGRLALQRYAYDDARRHLELAAMVASSAQEPETELEVVALLTTVIGVQEGYVGAAVDLLERAERLATGLGQERRGADFLYARWAAHSQGIDLPTSSLLADELYRRGQQSTDPLIQLYGHHAKGVDAWDHGRIGEAYRLLRRADEFVTRDLADHRIREEEDLLRYDLQLLVPAFMGFMSVFHGEVESGWERFEQMAAAVGSEPYPVIVWASFAGIAAVFADEVDLARRVAQRGLAADPQYDFLFLGTYVRVIGAWARAVSGDEPGGAADDIEALLDSLPQDQPRSGEGAWLTLLADACVRAGELDRAHGALARAEEAMATHGQVYAEPLRLLVLARLQHALREPAGVVRETLELARADATAREAFLLVGRADRLEAELFGLLDDQAPSTRSR